MERRASRRRGRRPDGAACRRRRWPRGGAPKLKVLGPSPLHWAPPGGVASWNYLCFGRFPSRVRTSAPAWVGCCRPRIHRGRACRTDPSGGWSSSRCGSPTDVPAPTRSVGHRGLRQLVGLGSRRGDPRPAVRMHREFPPVVCPATAPSPEPLGIPNRSVIAPRESKPVQDRRLRHAHAPWRPQASGDHCPEDPSSNRSGASCMP